MIKKILIPAFGNKGKLVLITHCGKIYKKSRYPASIEIS
jgi:hypothetical protein